MYLLLVVIVIILYLCYLFRWWKAQTAFPVNCSIIDTWDSDKVEAGDLIFTTTRNNRWRYAWWQHVAIVFEDKDGRKQVADLLRNGLHIVPVDLYVKMDTRDTVYGVRSIQKAFTEGQKKHLQLAIGSHRATRFNQHYVAIFILQRILPTLFIDYWVKGEHCTSFVADCLQRIGVLPHLNRHKMNVMDFTTDTYTGDYYGSAPMKLYLPR